MNVKSDHRSKFSNLSNWKEEACHDEIHEVLKEPSSADFALFNSEKSGGGLVLILTNLTARYNLSHASLQETC